MPRPVLHDLWNQRIPWPGTSDVALVEVWVSAHTSAPHAHPGVSVVWTETGWDYFNCLAFTGPVPPHSLVVIPAETIHWDRAGISQRAHSLAVYYPPGFPGWESLLVDTPVIPAGLAATIMSRLAVVARAGIAPLEELKALQNHVLTRYPKCQTNATSVRCSKPPRGQSRSAHLRAFTHAHGCTPGQHQRQQLVRRAAASLLAGMTLTEAALEAGFCDQSHMHRHFVQVFGVTPRNFVKCNSVQDRSTLAL